MAGGVRGWPCASHLDAQPGSEAQQPIEGARQGHGKVPSLSNFH